MDKVYISPEGLKKLKQKLKRMIEVERPAVIMDIATAREQGDLSENAEYTAAKEHQKFLEGEIAKLQMKFAALRVVNMDEINKNEVRFGAKLELFDLKRDVIVNYKIVGEDETGKEGNMRKISCKAPISKALLGKKMGDEVEVKAPVGILKYKIKSIKY
ncbi:MAG: transcription elongation factor GreA [Candidatus Cloacimonadota bacterium]|nr:transcription elongation factor GreA [Candidatus Cloacimonadota bacterium]